MADVGESEVRKVSEHVSTNEGSLEDLLGTLSKQINSSDWLKHNTPEKFEAENPEVAKVYKDLAEQKKINDAKNSSEKS